ncbi:MAG: CoA-transferase, partial [Anaerolineae bacterium]
DSFAMIRGGHVDVVVLGGLQVSEKGDLANWTVPGKMIRGMGGAADLVTGGKRVIVMMEHCTKEGHPKIVKECTYPLTGRECVHLVVTDLAVIEVTPAGLVLREVAPGVTADDVQRVTEPVLIMSKDLRTVAV